MRERVLVVHNAYQHRGGEDSVVEGEIALLRARGHEVMTYTRHNDEITQLGKLALVRDTFWSARTVADMRRLLKTEKPDVIHVHNTFPLISPALYWAAADLKVAVVQTLHNFRTLCPQAMFLRNQQVCEDCLGKLPWRGVLRRCYRNSPAQSAALAGMISMHRVLGTWNHKVTRYIALNEFCRQKFIEGGLPADRLVVKPNFVDFDSPREVERKGFLFVGRLSAEKGIRTLVEAAHMVGAAHIFVAGTGPEAGLLSAAANIDHLGQIERQQIGSQMEQAQALIMPSIWYETFGMVAIEAFASGTPVIASRLGAMKSLVSDGETGLLFNPGDAGDLAIKIRWAQENPAEMARMGQAARAHYENHFTAERNYQQLKAIYSDAIAEVKKH